MTLSELQLVLAKRIEILTDPRLYPEQLKKEIEISLAVAAVAKEMNRNIELVLRSRPANIVPGPLS